MEASIDETQEWFRKIWWEAEGLPTEVAVEGQTCDVVSSVYFGICRVLIGLSMVLDMWIYLHASL